MDMAHGLVLGLKHKPEFLPLFNLGEPVTTGDAVGGWSRVELHLKHGLAVLAADLANARDKQQMGLDFRQSYSLGVSRRDKTCPIQWPHTRLTGDGQRFVQRTARLGLSAQPRSADSLQARCVRVPGTGRPKYRSPVCQSFAGDCRALPRHTSI